MSKSDNSTRRICSRGIRHPEFALPFELAVGELSPSAAVAGKETTADGAVRRPPRTSPVVVEAGAETSADVVAIDLSLRECIRAEGDRGQTYPPARKPRPTCYEFNHT